MTLAKTMPELEALEQKFQEICSGLIYKPGSVFRIASQYLANWGIGVNPENAEYIENEASRSYFDEWRRGTKESNDAIHRAVSKAKLSNSNPDLNLELGMMAAEILNSMGSYMDRIVIADIGAAAGDTTVATLDFLDMLDDDGSLISRCHFYLLEPSIMRLAAAQKVLDTHIINEKGRVNYTLVASDHKTHLPMVGKGTFDMIISNAVFHHMTFPHYLEDMSMKLSDEGVLVVGDWYTAIWSQPAFVLDLMGRLGMGQREREMFEYAFDINRGDLTDLERELEPYQVESNRLMIDYELQIAKEFGGIHPESRLYFMEGHESLGDRMSHMADAGFESDVDELREKHRGFLKIDGTIKNLFPRSDFATVVAAGKIPGHKPDKNRRVIKDRINRAIIGTAR